MRATLLQIHHSTAFWGSEVFLSSFPIPAAPHAHTGSWTCKPPETREVALFKLLRFNRLRVLHEVNLTQPRVLPAPAVSPFSINSLFPTTLLCYPGAYVLHHRQANYRQVVHVDYLDYDYDDYSRFGRVENQLAN